MYAQAEVDGTFTQYAEDGSVTYIRYPDNSEIEYLYDVGLIFESDETGCKYTYMKNNKLAAELPVEGNKKIYYTNGQLKYEFLENGEVLNYSCDGVEQTAQNLADKDTIELIFDN